jgi:hypothetical protein
LTDIYTDIPEVKQIVTLTSASYAALFSSSLTDPNTLYVVSGSTSVVTLPEGLLSSSVTNFVDYSASVDGRINGIVTGTGFATTGSNTFTGDQTLIDNSGNFFTISDASGSMLLIAKGYTSSSLHLSSSISAVGSGSVNLIWKTTDNTADTIISGSGNIFSNQNAPTTGFKRYIGGNFNTFIGLTSVPQISGSMGFSPGMAQNYLAGGMIMRGPVSSSAWSINQNNILGTINIGTSAAAHADKLTSGLSFSQNYVGGIVNIIANQSALTGSTTTLTGNNINGLVQMVLSSSAVSFANNTINDSAFILTNQYYSSSVGLGQPIVARNTIAGNANTIIISGALATGTVNQPNVNENILGGGSNIIYSDIANARVSGFNSYNNANRNIIYGQALIVSASSFAGDLSSMGSAFFGRYNANDNIRNKTSDTIFAVGTGTSSARKTGFLIDSGSNSFFEGTVNISGSLLVNGIAPASVDTGSFATTGSNSFNGNQTITGSLLVKGNTTFATQDNISSNVILGLDAMINSTGATDSIAIGNNALRYASGSQQNFALGKNALLISSGSNNFALGNESLASNTTGNQNVALGIGALSSNTTGNKNLAIGNDAGIQASGSQNVFIGASAGSNITGSNNTIIGSFTGTAGSPLNNNIILADGAGNAQAQYSGSAWSFKGGFKLEKGTDKTSGVVNVGPSGTTVTNSLVTANSIILANIQNAQAIAGGPFTLSVSSITTGQFSLNTNSADSAGFNVGYLIINPA